MKVRAALQMACRVFRESARAALGSRLLWGGSRFIRAVQSSHYSPITMLPLPDQLNGQTGTLGTLPSSCTSTHARTSTQSTYTCNRIKQLGAEDTAGGWGKWNESERFERVQKDHKTQTKRMRECCVCVCVREIWTVKKSRQLLGGLALIWQSEVCHGPWQHRH